MATTRTIPESTDLVVNWGVQHTNTYSCKVLNAKIVPSKLAELQILQNADIPVPEFSEERPENPEGWLARTFKHHSANDLLRARPRGDFYTKFVEVVREYRIHVFAGNRIRAGIKVPRNEQAHPRFRTHTVGWTISYGRKAQEHLNRKIRRTAIKAVKALQYDFGAVDIGETADGAVIVFEVNSAPGLDGKTPAIYAQRILTYWNANDVLLHQSS
jgi:hypothetical protein